MITNVIVSSTWQPVDSELVTADNAGYVSQTPVTVTQPPLQQPNPVQIQLEQ